ncbi:MAG: hypothetical protein ACO1QB_16900 [Verrucomicrobiales bacterium]
MEMKKIVVLLPSGKLFDHLFSLGIKPVCEGLNLEVSRPPVQLQNPPVLDQVHRRIRDADLIVADVSAGNASILYTIGYAQAIGKPLLLCAIAAEDFPLNAQLFEPIIHAARAEVLALELKSRLKSLWNTDAASLASMESGQSDPDKKARLEFESIFGDILKQHHHRHTGPISKESDTTFVLENNDMDLALVQDLARHARSMNMRLKLL